MTTKELIKYTRSSYTDGSLGTSMERAIECRKEIIKRLEELDDLKRVVNDPHITQEETMRRLLQLCSK